MSGKNTVYSITRAQRLKRVSVMEIQKFKKCGGKVTITAGIEDPNAIKRVLKHLGLVEASQAKTVHRQRRSFSIQPHYSDISTP